MRNLRRFGAASLAMMLALAACGHDREKDAQRELARRNSCVAAELALQAKERLASLDTMLASTQGTPLQNATIASRTYAAAYKAWADAASRAADLADSAATADQADDSAKYARQSADARPRRSAAGSTEANAAQQYANDVTRALGNPDHPCNKPQGDTGD
jgi:hypothetical protein